MELIGIQVNFPILIQMELRSFIKEKMTIQHLLHFLLRNIQLILEKTLQIYGLGKILKPSILLLLKCGDILFNNLSHTLILRLLIKSKQIAI